MAVDVKKVVHHIIVEFAVSITNMQAVDISLYHKRW